EPRSTLVPMPGAHESCPHHHARRRCSSDIRFLLSALQACRDEGAGARGVDHNQDGGVLSAFDQLNAELGALFVIPPSPRRVSLSPAQSTAIAPRDLTYARCAIRPTR